MTAVFDHARLARVGLGALGVVSEVTLQLAAEHHLLEHTYVASAQVLPRCACMLCPLAGSCSRHTPTAVWLSMSAPDALRSPPVRFPSVRPCTGGHARLHAKPAPAEGHGPSAGLRLLRDWSRAAGLPHVAGASRDVAYIGLSASLQEVARNHRKLLAKHRHLRYMWIPYTDAVVVVTNDPVREVHSEHSRPATVPRLPLKSGGGL